LLPDKWMGDMIRAGTNVSFTYLHMHVNTHTRTLSRTYTTSFCIELRFPSNKSQALVLMLKGKF